MKSVPRRSRRLRPKSFMLGIGILLMLVPPAAGSDAKPLIEPRVEQARFEELVRSLDIDDDQAIIAEMIFSGYAETINDLGQSIEGRMEEASLQRVEDALAGRIYIDPQELRDLRVGLLQIQRESWNVADEQFDLLLSDVATMIVDRKPEHEHAFMKIRRAAFLHPRQRNEMDETYAGEGVDVVQLLERALEPEGELKSMTIDAFDAIVAEYEFSVDQYLRAHAAADRAGRLEQAIARVERDKTALARAQQQHVARWQTLDQINQRAMARIGEIVARELGSAAHARWQERIDRASFPWLMVPPMPEREHEWIAERAPQTKADEIIAAFRPRLTALQRDAVSILRRGRATHGIMLRSGMDPTMLDRSDVRNLYQELLRNSGERSTLVAETSAALHTLLDDAQRARMRSDIAAAAFGRRR